MHTIHAGAANNILETMGKLWYFFWDVSKNDVSRSGSSYLILGFHPIVQRSPES